ncbi:MAG: cupin domain-containing protein [Roseicyclus sp.]
MLFYSRHGAVNRGLALALGAALTLGPAHAQDGYPPLDVLLQSGTTIIGQPFHYPEGPAQVTVAIVTMQPGERTAWHIHDAPLIAHILQGELTLDYGPDGTRVVQTGDTFVEAFQSRHQGFNSGADVVRILAVFAGAEGTANTILE